MSGFEIVAIIGLGIVFGPLLVWSVIVAVVAVAGAVIASVMGFYDWIRGLWQ